jgi:hypothetical protein
VVLGSVLRAVTFFDIPLRRIILRQVDQMSALRAENVQSQA